MIDKMVTGFPHLLNNWNSDKTPPKTAPSRASQVWWWNNEIPTTFVDTFTTQLTHNEHCLSVCQYLTSEYNILFSTGLSCDGCDVNLSNTFTLFDTSLLF